MLAFPRRSGFPGSMAQNFGWVREGEIAGMGYPGPGAWSWLKEEGIGAVVSLTERAPPGRPETAGLRHLHLPVPDFGTPSDADLDHGLAWIRARIDEGRPVAVHCAAGYGRTGTLLAAYLAETGLDAEAAIALVRQLRPGSIETGAQEDVVRRLAERRLHQADGDGKE